MVLTTRAQVQVQMQIERGRERAAFLTISSAIDDARSIQPALLVLLIETSGMDGLGAFRIDFTELNMDDFRELKELNTDDFREDDFREL